MAYLIPEASKSSKLPVKNFIKNGKWNTDKLKTILSDHICEHINTIGIGNPNLEDQVFWDLTDCGKYSNKTAWNLVRSRNTKQPLINKTQVVCWQKPDTSSTKLNTDGSFNNNNGKAGLGGALRDDNGDLIMAFSIKAHCNNHNIAEAKAAWYGINWCLQNGYNNFTIESDSTVITDMLKNKKASNFRLNKIIQDTTELLRQATVKLTYC
ncbi:hypothetical protein P3S68_000386 [Capsicum galapagoense]